MQSDSKAFGCFQPCGTCSPASPGELSWCPNCHPNLNVRWQVQTGRHFDGGVRIIVVCFQFGTDSLRISGELGLVL